MRTQNNTLDPKILEELILNQKFGEIHQMDNMVLFIGDTGVGKSTIITYLLGCDFLWDRKDKKFVISNALNIKHPDIAPKYAVDSCTTYAEIFKNYCDFPGFDDTRGIAYKVCASISTELAIKSARSINSVAIVLNWTSLKATKYKALIVVAKTLAKLMPNFDNNNNSSSMLFLINNNPSTRDDPTNDEIIETTNQLINKIKKEGLEGAELSECEQVCKILNIMVTQKDNLLIIDIEDKGKSRNKFNKLIKHKKKIDKSSFKFNDYDISRCIFDKAIEEHASNGLTLLQNYLSINKNIDEYSNLIEATKNQNKLNQEITPLLNKVNNTTFFNDSDTQNFIISALKNSINELEKQIEKNSLEMKKLEIEKTSLNEKIKNLSTDVPVLLWSDEINETRLMFFGWAFGISTTKKFEYSNYSKIPFEDNTADCKEYVIEEYNNKGGGTFTRDKVDPKNGIYIATYKSGKGEDGIAKVQIKVKSKIFNASFIKNQEKLVDDLESKINDLQKKNNSFITQKDERNKFIKEINEKVNHDDLKNDLEQIIKNVSISQIEEKITNEKIILEGIEKKIEEKKIWFDLIQKIHSYLKYESNFIINFLDDYKKYIDAKKLGALKNDIEITQLRRLIDQEIIDIINGNYDDEKLSKFKGSLDNYQKRKQQFNINIPEKYDGYSYLCNALLEKSNKIREASFLEAIKILGTYLSDDKENEKEIIRTILCNELERNYLSELAILYIFQHHKSSLKCRINTTDCNSRIWIILHEIIRHSSQSTSNKMISDALNEFIEVAGQSNFRQRLLLNKNKSNDKSLLQVILEQNKSFLLKIFIGENDCPDLLVLSGFIELNQEALFKSYFERFPKGDKNKYVNHPIINDKSLILLAIRANKEGIVRYLLEYLEINSATIKSIHSLFYQAVICGHLEISKVFIEKSKDLLSENNEQRQNIFHAVFLESNGMNEKMLSWIWNAVPPEKRKNLMSQTDVNGYLPMHYAVQCEDPEIIDFWGTRFYASKHSTVTTDDMIRFLNTAGKNDKNTGLHLAIKAERTSMVEKILSFSEIRLYEKNIDQQTPRHMASVAKSQLVMDLLDEKLIKNFILKLHENLPMGNQILKDFVKTIESALEDKNEKLSTEVIAFIVEKDLFRESYFIRQLNELKQAIIRSVNEDKLCINRPAFCLILLHNSLTACSYFQPQLSQSNSTISFFESPNKQKTIKQKAFCNAIRDSLQDYYFVSRALYEKKVDPASDMFDSVKETIETFSPTLAGATGFVGGIILTGGITVLKLIKIARDKNTRWEASRFVEAFGVCSATSIQNNEKDIRIHHQKISAVANTLYNRYKDQIEQCTLSTSGQEVKVMSPSKYDGVVVLAQCIVDRIFKHIINNGSKNTNDDKNFVIKFFDALTAIGDAKDVYVETRDFSIIERCIFAILKEDEGKDIEVLTEESLKNPNKRKWKAGGILVKTGYKIFNKHTEDYNFYVRNGEEKIASLHDEYGFCRIDNIEECKRRNYTLVNNVRDKFAEEKNSDPYDKLMYI